MHDLYGQELPPDPLSREAEDHALICALQEGNAAAPWRTRWDDRRLHSWPASSAEVGASHTGPWQISEYTAMRYWFMYSSPERENAARRCLEAAIREFRVAFADELAEADASHQQEGVPSHTNWGHYYTFGELERQGVSVDNNSNGLWPVERKLANMITFLCRIKPGYSEAMDELPANQVLGEQ